MALYQIESTQNGAKTFSMIDEPMSESSDLSGLFLGVPYV